MSCAVRLVTLVLALAAMLPFAPVAASQLASRPAAEWMKTLDAPERVAGLKIDDVISRLKLAPGQIVADLGAGTGLFAVPMARAVGPSGRVYAVELDQDFLTHIDGKAREGKVANVQTVLGTATDPRLPARNIDVAFFHDVLHHVENRAAYIKSVAAYLKPGGRIAVIEFNAAQSPHRDEPTLVVTKEQTAAWMTAAGLAPSDDINLFPDKWFTIYTRR